MRKECDGTSLFRRRAAGRKRASAYVLAAITAMFCSGVLAEPIYYVLSQQISQSPKYDSAKAACDAYRDYVQAGNDGVNPGGAAVVIKYPREDLYPSLMMGDYCMVNWSRGSSSFNYWLSVYAGGCLPGRRRKETVPLDSFFAEPWGCESLPCPVPPLKPLPPDDFCTQSLEAGKGKDVNNACPFGLTPAMKEEAQCLAGKLAALGITLREPSGTIRTAAYQAHLKEIWDNWNRLERLMVDPALSEACATRWAEVDFEKRRHGIVRSPSRKKKSMHEDGNAIDIDTEIASALISLVTTETSDVEDYIRSPYIGPRACNLRWGGRFSDYDYVHFGLSQ